MARRRFFVDRIHAGAAELSGEDAHHLTRVLRVEPGQRYEISDGQSAWLAEISEARGQRVVFRVVEPVASAALPVHITLCAALIKFDRFEWMVEKATELGVERIRPVETARCEKGLSAAAVKRSARWERISHESGQQSRRLRVPEILPVLTLERTLAEDGGHRYFMDENEAPPLLHLLPPHRTPADRVAVLIGPEGGWTDVERERALAAGWRAASLSPQVLRAETAAAAALAILVQAWMAK